MPDYPYDQNKTYSIPFPRKVTADGQSPEQSEMMTIMVKPYPEHDGGMVGFLDPTTGKYVGCCGIRYWEANAKLALNYDFVPGDD